MRLMASVCRGNNGSSVPTGAAAVVATSTRKFMIVDDIGGCTCQFRIPRHEAITKYSTVAVHVP